MHKISNEEFFEGIRNDLKERENKKYESFGDFSVLEKDFSKISKAFFDIKEEDLLANSNNVYVECKIKKEDAKIGCNKTIQLKRKQYNKNEKVKIAVKIPQNVQSGNKIVLKGEGNRDENKVGNLVIEIKIK